MQIPYFRPPYINYSAIEPKIREIVDSRVYTKGAYRSLLEARLSHYLGVDHVITCASGTAALWIAMRVMHQMCRTKRILMPAFNWQSDRIAAESAGYWIEYADIDPDTWLPVMLLDRGYDSCLALDTFGSVDTNEYPENTILQYVTQPTRSERRVRDPEGWLSASRWQPRNRLPVERGA
jgi:hypothetical protein